MTKQLCLPLLFLLLVMQVETAFSQEVELPLSGNPVAEKYYSLKPFIKSTRAVASLDLPFVDDFSGTMVEPDQNLWEDNYAFVNRSYGVDPPTIGVATLDAVDSDGSIYPNATIDPKTYSADRLTSREINLAASPADSIYLSFYYQPAGLGEEPDADDSLCVDFYDPASEFWINVWHIPGDTLSPFRQVMIPITDPRFLVDGFRFRFRNLASLPYNDDYFDLRGNVDHWNIDYVRLDRDRSYKDTIIRDVAVIKNLPSLIKDNEEIPWDHFEAAYSNYANSTSTLSYRNNDSITRNITRYVRIDDLLSGESYTPAQPTSRDIAPYDTANYKFIQFYPFDFGVGDSGKYRIITWMRTDTFDNKNNDTIYRIQRFRDFYAADDGTAEAGYGIRGQNTANGKVAARFKCYKEDYIGGVDIYFNQTLDSVNLDYYFKLEVWDEGDNEKPGPALYIDDNDYTPVYSDKINGFVRYAFSNPVKVSGTFYVGWMQYNKYLLNVGLDKNNAPSNTRTFFNFTGTWQASIIPGTLMIRPYLYRNQTGIQDEEINTGNLLLYPNPASDYVYLEFSELQEPGGIAELFDLSGRKILSSYTEGNVLSTADIPEGIYILKLSTPARTYTTKLIIAR